MKHTKKQKNLYKTLSILFIISSLILLWALPYLLFKDNSLKTQESVFMLLSSNQDFSIKPLQQKIQRDYDLVADKSSISLIEGKTTDVFAYNNQVPGPILRGKVGDTIKVNFKNNLDFPTTIHWHGIQLENSMDGVPDITQTLVNSQETFIYEFTLKDSGIYWYHPHYNTDEQIEMGLYGIIVVDDDKISVDKDTVYVLDDVRLDGNYQIAPKSNHHMDVMHGRYGNFPLINGAVNYDIEAKKGELIRLRLVNTANARIFNFAIEDHKLLVVGHDIGLVEKPYEVDSLIMAPGERYDILVYLDKNKQDYKILDKSYNTENMLGYLRYNETSQQDKKEYYNSLKNIILNENIPDWQNKESEKEITIELEGIQQGMMNIRWTLDGKSFPENPSNISLKENKFYKIKFVNTQNQIHPMHLHGQKFLILTRDGKAIEQKGYKDTVLIYPSEEVEIGLMAQEKGTWLNHCHILEHAEAGMLGFLIVE